MSSMIMHIIYIYKIFTSLMIKVMVMIFLHDQAHLLFYGSCHKIKQGEDLSLTKHNGFLHCLTYRAHKLLQKSSCMDYLFGLPHLNENNMVQVFMTKIHNICLIFT